VLNPEINTLGYKRRPPRPSLLKQVTMPFSTSPSSLEATLVSLPVKPSALHHVLINDPSPTRACRSLCYALWRADLHVTAEAEVTVMCIKTYGR
jgi:hypothetical protein